MKNKKIILIFLIVLAILFGIANIVYAYYTTFVDASGRVCNIIIKSNSKYIY